MRKTRFTESQIFQILKESDNGISVPELCRTHQVGQSTFYKWRAKYGGMDASMIKRMKELEEENHRLKKMYAESQMDNQIIREAMAKKW